MIKKHHGIENIMAKNRGVNQGIGSRLSFI